MRHIQSALDVYVDWLGVSTLIGRVRPLRIADCPFVEKPSQPKMVEHVIASRAPISSPIAEDGQGEGDFAVVAVFDPLIPLVGGGVGAGGQGAAW